MRVDVLEDALVSGQVEQLAPLQAQLFKAPRKVLEGHFFSVDVTVMQLKLCQARSWKRKDLMKIEASMGYRDYYQCLQCRENTLQRDSRSEWLLFLENLGIIRRISCLTSHFQI